MNAVIKQYNTIKFKYRDAVLLFRTGEFYMAFGNDAKILSEVTGANLVIGDEDAEIKHSASLPSQSLDVALRKLVKNGYKVGICEVLKEPAKEKKACSRSMKNSFK